ncbi:type II toxin-antitoxin system RelE/ParE family toxin [Gloeobacter kilaueensis]|uniref:Plasmid stabilization system n=1 Tax=Gloeobacter kilaueensis (strain ATCC BAA-2537 / CCAP 1431/1 / ULC 316 / JS1) TaxID=1183438 RepID=U5QFI3_GLOK1|nr:type II toxin-antitoxin system RelE/ParE family toxin [Gloeobacter kilaueensis]AGY57701.1 plasmid stabilization system [Gloeobacter kilaueensis JS1]
MLGEKFETIARQSNIGRKRSELAAGLRSFPINRYVIFYLPISGGIEVVRILHGARDLEAIFLEES